MARPPGRHRSPSPIELTDEDGEPRWWQTVKKQRLIIIAALVVACLTTAALLGMSRGGSNGAPAEFHYPRPGEPTSIGTPTSTPTGAITSSPSSRRGGPGTGDGPDTDPRYDSCAEVVDAGLGPYRAGRDPEYSWYPDDDRDGMACERAPARPRPVHYRSCAEAIEAGAAPLRRGEPGYSRRLDRDGDGVACD